ncbi:uncharacterized protein LOC143673080 isoform X6 [Tamandua tetradactyla]|uniref:uncharacterized protein LOC143673080 isoform X6 n=1 Tax=Tamandua tetradactyla TaxID=48850 RepID=UPI0040537E45
MIRGENCICTGKKPRSGASAARSSGSSMGQCCSRRSVGCGYPETRRIFKTDGTARDMEENKDVGVIVRRQNASSLSDIVHNCAHSWIRLSSCHCESTSQSEWPWASGLGSGLEGRNKIDLEQAS